MDYNIPETGIKGFLKWMQEDNPGLYEKVAPELVRQVPAVFSGYEQSKVYAANSGMSGFADTTQSSPGLIDIAFDSSQVAPIDAVNDNSDIAQVADQGSSTPSITNQISNIVGGIASLYMAKNQVDLQNQVTQIQLQRAQAGLPPLAINTSQLGVPQVAVGLSSSTQSLVMWGGLALLGVLLIGGLSRGRSK